MTEWQTSSLAVAEEPRDALCYNVSWNLVNCYTTIAYTKKHLKRLAINEWPWQRRDSIGYLSLPFSGRIPQKRLPILFSGTDNRQKLPLFIRDLDPIRHTVSRAYISQPPNGISIGSSIFSQYISMIHTQIYRQTHGQTHSNSCIDTQTMRHRPRYVWHRSQ